MCAASVGRTLTSQARLGVALTLGRAGALGSAPLPDAASKAAQATGLKRYRSFVESLARRMEAGPKLRDELSDEVPPGELVSP